MVTFLLKIKRDWDVPNVTLAVLSAFVNQSNGIASSIIESRCKVTWLLLIGVISITYSNIPQSIVVVPSVYHTYIQVEDMFRENFTFAIDPSGLYDVKHPCSKSAPTSAGKAT